MSYQLSSNTNIIFIKKTAEPCNSTVCILVAAWTHVCLVSDFFSSSEALCESGMRLPFSVVPFFRICRPHEINTFIYTVSSRLIILLYTYWLFLKLTLILCLRLFRLFSYIWIGFWKLINLTCCLSCINFEHCLSVSWFVGCNLLILCCNVFLSVPDISTSSFLLQKSHWQIRQQCYWFIFYTCCIFVYWHTDIHLSHLSHILRLTLADSLDSRYLLWPFMFR